jgi:hypothetical protein
MEEMIMGIEVRKNATFNVSADRLWSILADDFDKVGDWARTVDSSSAKLGAVVPEGANVGGRVCEAPGFGAIDEILTSYNAEERSYAFTATASKIPSFVRNITNHTAVKALGPEQSELELKITADADGIRGAIVTPMMNRKFSGAIDATIEDLRVFAESGNISDEKTKALAKAGR